MWKEVNMMTKEVLQPWQDSNLQSPDPKSGALSLSIRPHGSLLPMYSNYSFIFTKQQHVLQRSVKQKLSSYLWTDLKEKFCTIVSIPQLWILFLYGCSAFTFSFSPATIMSCRPLSQSLTRAHESCKLSLRRKKTKRSHQVLFFFVFLRRLLVTQTPDHLTTWLVVAWSFQKLKILLKVASPLQPLFAVPWSENAWQQDKFPGWLENLNNAWK